VKGLEEKVPAHPANRSTNQKKGIREQWEGGAPTEALAGVGWAGGRGREGRVEGGGALEGGGGGGGGGGRVGAGGLRG